MPSSLNHKCRYCGVSCPQIDMTSIPTNHIQLSKWIEILGSEFAKNINKFKTNRICLRHMENRNTSRYRLPKNPNIIYRKCKYCGISRPENETISVPSNPEKLTEWMKILGSKFTQRIKKSERNSICLNHFESQAEYPSSNLRRTLKLTINDDDDEEIRKEQIQKKIGNDEVMRADKIEDRTHTEPDNSEVEVAEKDEVVRVEQSQEIKREVEDNQNMNSNGPISEVLVSETVEMEIENHSNSTVVRLETIEKEQECEEMEPMIISNQTVAILTIMEPNQENAPKPIISEVSSSEIAEIVNSNSVVMKLELNDHIEDLVSPKPEVSESETEKIENSNSAVELEQEMEETDDCVEMVPPKREVLDHEEMRNGLVMVSSKSEITPLIQCRVCGIQNEEKTMTTIPTIPKILKKWVENLDPDFVINMSQNPPPHFVCYRHVLTLLNRAYDE